MSLDYIYRSKAQPISVICPNEIILKEIQSLVKQEKYSLESENDQLRKNNEDLTNRIQDLYNEFDTSTRVYKEHRDSKIDAATQIRHLRKKSKSAQKKNSDLVKNHYDQQSTVSELKGQLVSSEDSLSMMKLLARESDVEIGIKNKEVELLEAQNELLQIKIKDVENLNKDLRKECRTTARSMKTLLEKPNDQLKPEIMRNETSSPTYIDIFNNKEDAKFHSIKKSNKSRKIDVQQFSISNLPNDETLKMSNHNHYESALSPIYADINAMRKQKFSSMVPDQIRNGELESNDKHQKFFPEDQRFIQDVDKEFVKLNEEQQILNEKLNTFNSNYNNPLIRVHEDGTEMLLKKTSEEVVKISTEQQQIIDLLLKNSTTLDQLQQMNEIGKRYPHYRNKFTQSSLNDKSQNKQLKNLSCQTDEKIEDKKEFMVEVKTSTTENNTDILRLINDQNEKIRELTDKFSLIERRSSPAENIFNTKIFDSFYDDAEKDYPVTNKSENSFEEISNLTDVMGNESNQAIATFMAIADESKSLTSLLLSTTESKLTHSSDIIVNTLGPNTDSFDNIDNLPLESTVELTSEALPKSSEKIIQTSSDFVENVTSAVMKTKSPSKIPKLMWSKSVDVNEKTESDNTKKIFSNDLESSYETLYDPVSSARYEKENSILM